MNPNFGRTASDYMGYRRPFPPELFERLRRFAVGLPGQWVLDVGAGTQLFGNVLAGQGCRVVASDVSHLLLAASLNGVAGRVAARVESLPFPDDRFDAVAAAQCWHWFNRSHAPLEIRRVLRPGGALVVAYHMYVPTPSSVAEAVERLILRHRPAWRHANSAGINGQVLRDVQSNGFTGIESFSFDVVESFTHDQWRGFIRTTSAVGASLPPAQLLQFDEAHAALLRDWPEPLKIPHRIFAAIAHKPLSPL